MATEVLVVLVPAATQMPVSVDRAERRATRHLLKQLGHRRSGPPWSRTYDAEQGLAILAGEEFAGAEFSALRMYLRTHRKGALVAVHARAAA